MPTNLLDYRRTKTIANIDTFYERNGTYLRALIALPTTTDGDLEVIKVKADLAIGVSRIIILVAPTLEALDEHTARLQRLAAVEDWSLVAADGMHRTLIERIRTANPGEECEQ
jgi:hypothetical protein